MLLRRTLNQRIGQTGLPPIYLAKVWGSAIVAGAAGWAIHHALGTHHKPILVAFLVLLPYGGLYFALTALLGVAEARMFFGRAMSRLRGA